MRVWLIVLILAQSAMTTAAQNGVITGRVSSADGSPAVGKRVAALAVDDSPASASTLIAGLGQTDKDGRYALEGVPPGRYFLMVGSLDVPAYFPGVWDRKEATAFTVAAGARKDGVDVRLPVLPDSVKVQGRVVRAGAETVGVANAEVRLAERAKYTAISNAEGDFEFPAVQLGMYRLTAATQGKSASVVVGATALTGLMIVSTPGFRVAGHVIRAGASSVQPLRRLHLIGSAGLVAANIEADGSFVFPYIPPGSYRVEAEPAIVALMKNILVQTEITDFRVDIPQGVRVAGQVILEDRNSREALPGQIVLNGVSRAAIAPDGTFEFAIVVPGTYQAELSPATFVRMPVLEIEVGEHDVTGIHWMIPDPAKVDLRALLESADPLDQAWAGWTAGQARRTEVIPLLEKALLARLSDSRTGEQEDVAIDTISDALIRLDAKLDLVTVHSLYAQRPAQGLVLLSRMDSSANGFLFELLEREQNLRWFATANLLLKRKVPGLAASLIGRLRLEAHVTVCDSVQQCGRVAGGLMAGGDDGGVFGRLDNFPPWPGYTLSRDQGDLLGAGPVPVFAARNVALPGSRPAMAIGDFASSMSPTTEDRLTYIKATAPGARVNLSQREDRVTEWRGREALDAEVERFRQDILSRYATMLQDLIAAGVLTAEEASTLAEPQLTVIVDALRIVG